MNREDIDKEIGRCKDSVDTADKQATIDNQTVKSKRISEDATDLDGLTIAEKFKSADTYKANAGTDKRLIKSKNILLTLIAVIGISLLIFILSGLLGDSKEQIARADEAVEALFMDEQHIFLNPELSKFDFVKAIEAIDDLSHKNQSVYKESYEQAQLMYDAINELSTIYEQDDLIIQGNQVLPADELLVRASVTQSLLDEKHAAFEANQNQQLSDLLSAEIKSLYQYADSVVAYTEIAQTSINNLPKSIKNRSQLLDVINAIQAVELQLTDYSKQPKVVELYEQLQSYANKVGDIIVSGLEMGEYDSTFWEEVYWTDTLVYYFEGELQVSEKLISLTFDDGPNEEFTTQLLDVLSKHDVKATFFVMGAYVDEFPEVARRIVSDGHTIANHTYNHPDLSTVSDEEVVKQFIWTQESIHDVTGVWPTIYRLPFGAGGKRVIDLMDDMTSILWNIDSMDWYYQDTTLTYNHIMENLHPNSLLLMHDTHQATPDVIDLLIPVLKDQGYEFVAPTEVGFDLRYYTE